MRYLAPFFDILCQTVCQYNIGIKRTVLIRQIDLWDGKPLDRGKIGQKLQGTEVQIYPLYFERALL